MFVRCTSGEAREAMKLLLVLALLFRATHADAAFGAPRAQGLLPRGPRAGHAVRLPRRPIAPELRVASTDEQDPQVTTQRVRRPAAADPLCRPPCLATLSRSPSLAGPRFTGRPHRTAGGCRARPRTDGQEADRGRRRCEQADQGRATRRGGARPSQAHVRQFACEARSNGPTPCFTPGDHRRA